MRLSTFSFINISNWIIFGQDVVLFLGLNVNNGVLFFTENFRNTYPQFYTFLIIPQAWTLSIELVFYLIAPLIVRRNIRLILWLILASLLLRAYIYFGLGWTNDPWTYRFFPTEIIFFLLGNISYRVYSFIKDDQKYRKFSLYLMALFLLVLLFYQHIEALRWFKLLLYYSFAVFSLPFIFNLTKNSKKDRKIGDLSYPIYLVHGFIIAFSTPIIRWLGLNSFKTPILIILSILAAFILLKIIADPIEKFRQARWSKAIPST